MTIRVECSDGVAVAVIDRPERKNAFDREHYDALGGALDRLADDGETRVVIVTGAGGAFSAGQDLKEMAELAASVAHRSVDPASTTKSESNNEASSGFTVLLDALERFPLPLVAAVDGVAVGIGMTLLPWCDIVVVGRATRMRVPFTELGVPPEAGSSLLFAERMGWQRAAELLLTSRWIDADEAVRYGLALESCDDPLARAREIAARIASLSPYSTRAVKTLMAAARRDAARTARAREESMFAELFRGGGYGQ